MNIVLALFSLRSISFIAFLATAGFLGYEVYLLWKSRQQNQAPDIPQFTDATPLDLSGLNLPQNQTAPVTKKPLQTYILIGVLAVMLIMFGIGALFARTAETPQPQATLTQPTVIPTPLPNVIKVYDQTWTELSKLRAGETVYVGLQNVAGADIDKVRIRINETGWTAEHVTTAFDQEHNVFYRTFVIPAGIGKLQIEGQLYSRKSGWLGE